ncbi:hypothetical protein E8E11_011029 [Didymella keratinophila]|nr:hypothetical protein E8E11_011029 [Didymella keratinophila]
MRVFQKDGKQLSIALYVPVTLYGAEEEQIFVVQYDADDLRNRSPAALDSAPVLVPNDRLDDFIRNSEFETTTLTLNLKQPAPIWCPLNQVMVPQPISTSVTAFAELVELAKATVVHLVFDYKWLTGTQQAAIQRLTKGKVSLEGLSLNKYFIKNWELKDWTHFAPATAPALPPEASNKRTRPVSGLGSTSPPAKRAILDDPNAPSPTEVASSPPEYVKPDSEADFQTQAIRHVVVRELPAVVAAVLPAILPAIFAAPDPHMNSFDSDASTFPKMQLTSAGAVFVPHLLAHLQPQIQDMLNRALSHTRTQRENAELAFEEDVDEKKLELHEITENGKMELERALAHNTDHFRHQLRDDGDDIAVDIEDQSGSLRGNWDGRMFVLGVT